MVKGKKMDIRIIGNPVAQGRPRAFRRGKFIGMYDPKQSKDWKSIVAFQAKQQLNGNKLLEGALQMNLLFLMPRPKGIKKDIFRHTKKPDLDNLCKAIKDALKDICYKDDSQICVLQSEKRYIYTILPEEPGVMIEIFTL